MKPGQEPLRPDRAIGQVAEDRVRFPPAEVLRGRRQVDRPEVVEPGQRVAGVDQVAQVPVAAPGQSGETGGRRALAAGAARRDHRQPEDQRRAGQEEVELGPGRQARSEADDGECSRRERGTLAPALTPSVQRDRNRGKQEEDPDDVAPRLPRLVRQRRHAERDRPESERPRRHPVGPADAPASNQAADEPSEVQQRRQQVAIERAHADRVEDFCIRRVEPCEELRRYEVQIPGVPALEEPRRERPVVPGAIEPGHARIQASSYPYGEMDDCHDRDRSGDEGREIDAPPAGWRGMRGALRAAPSSAPLIPRQDPPAERPYP